MEKKFIITLQNDFNAISKVIEKVKITCENSKVDVSDHFLVVRKMVTI